jgi:hypothetical protein
VTEVDWAVLHIRRRKSGDGEASQSHIEREDVEAIHKERRGIGNRTLYSMSMWPDAIQGNEFCFGRKHLKAKYNIGDYVRISRDKGLFGKGYTANWSQEQFIVTSIRESTCGGCEVIDKLSDADAERIRSLCTSGQNVFCSNWHITATNCMGVPDYLNRP